MIPSRIGEEGVRERVSALGWPILRKFETSQLDEISLPVGGIGTGTIGFGGRGQLRDFELGGRPSRGYRPEVALFAARVHAEGGSPIGRLLEGPIGEREYVGKVGSTATNHGLPRFAEAAFESAYPFGQVVLSDPDLPNITIGAFNPLIPSDIEGSSWPIGVFKIAITNTFEVPLEFSVVGALENFVGDYLDAAEIAAVRNIRRHDSGMVGVHMTAADHGGTTLGGQFVLGVLAEEEARVTTRTAWSDPKWSGSLIDFWDDFMDDGALEERSFEGERPVASVCVSATVEPGAQRVFTFLYAWSFSERKAWSSGSTIVYDDGAYTNVSVGNYYAACRPDPWDTACSAVAALPELERATVDAVSAIVGSPVPDAVADAALSNLSTLRSQTVFRTREGEFYGWEGVLDRTGSCFGNCSHVWGYEFATSFLFSELAWSFRSTQFHRALDERGHMSFRVGLPAEHSRDWRIAAADGQMASLIHLYFDWRLSGDDERLRHFWPSARKALEFAWVPGGWDEDQDGVMEGCQHNTMDVEFYGPHPQMTTWYLAALKACGEMADAMGDVTFGDRCRALFRSGAAYVDEELFTGTHYRQIVKPLAPGAFIADGLRMGLGAADPASPDLQLGDGVLIDQLVGQYASRVTGLGSILKQENVTQALATVRDRNFKTSFRTSFNPMRSFALGDESGVVMCSYDGVRRPARPFPYYAEVMSGFEYVAAAGMIYEGLQADGLRIVESIRERYDGAKRDPFDETELGHHYARSLASWSVFVAWTGFDYDARIGQMTIAIDEPDTRTFWSTGSAWGIWARGKRTGELHVRAGEVSIRSLRVGTAEHVLTCERSLSAGDSLSVNF